MPMPLLIFFLFLAVVTAGELSADAPDRAAESAAWTVDAPDRAEKRFIVAQPMEFLPEVASRITRPSLPYHDSRDPLLLKEEEQGHSSDQLKEWWEGRRDPMACLRLAYPESGAPESEDSESGLDAESVVDCLKCPRLCSHHLRQQRQQRYRDNWLDKNRHLFSDPHLFGNSRPSAPRLFKEQQYPTFCLSHSEFCDGRRLQSLDIWRFLLTLTPPGGTNP